MDNKLHEEHIRNAYRYILGREPESEIVVSAGVSYYQGFDDLRNGMLASDEFRDAAEAIALRRSTIEWIGLPIFRHSHIYLNVRDIGVSRSILFRDEWEPQVLHALERLIDPETTFLDVGANVGYFTLWAAEQVAQRGGTVISVEANPAVLPYLNASIIQSRTKDKVTLVPYAASDKLEVVYFSRFREGNLGGAGVEGQGEDRTPVIAAPLDLLLQGVKGRISFVKMDIEGSEPRAIAGMTGLLNTHRPKLLVEFNQSKLAALGSSATELLDLLRGLEYQPFSIESDNSEKALSPLDALSELNHVDYTDILFRPCGTV